MELLGKRLLAHLGLQPHHALPGGRDEQPGGRGARNRCQERDLGGRAELELRHRRLARQPAGRRSVGGRHSQLRCRRLEQPLGLEPRLRSGRGAGAGPDRRDGVRRLHRAADAVGRRPRDRLPGLDLRHLGQPAGAGLQLQRDPHRLWPRVQKLLDGDRHNPRADPDPDFTAEPHGNPHTYPDPGAYAAGRPELRPHLHRADGEPRLQRGDQLPLHRQPCQAGLDRGELLRDRPPQPAELRRADQWAVLPERGHRLRPLGFLPVSRRQYRGPDHGQRPDLEGIRRVHGHGLQEDHQRPLRGTAQPLRLLLGHQRRNLSGERGRLQPARRGPGLDGDHAQLRLHHAQLLQRHARLLDCGRGWLAEPEPAPNPQLPRFQDTELPARVGVG